MIKLKIGYIRVSTILQNKERQLEALEKYNIDKLYSETASAKDTNRPELKTMLDFAREGDTIYILDFSRLARSTKDLLNIVDFLNNKGVKLFSIKEQLDTNTPNGKLMLTMLGAIYEFERTNLLERQKEGIAIAKAKGIYKGRKAIEVDDRFVEHYNKYLKRELNKKELASVLGISRPTLDKLILEHRNKS